MKKLEICLLLMILCIPVFSQEKVEVQLDPVKNYLSAYKENQNHQTIKLYENRALAKKYVKFLIKQKIFGELRVKEIDLFENNEFWLVCLGKGKTKDKYQCDAEFELTFLMSKETGEISSVIKY